MSFPALTARSLYHWSRRLVHPLVDSFLPITYTPHEYRARKAELDPAGARSSAKRNPHTTDRITRIGSLLSMDPSKTMGILDEARNIRLANGGSDHAPQLASPMCCEDRFATYVVTRVLAPEVVVETGVAHGASSAYVLSAINATGHGCLISIELSDDPDVGRLVPKKLRSRWDLRRGHSLIVLPRVLAERGPIDMFVHDSWHRCRHVTRELELVWPHLSPGGVMCVHDILANNAFPRFVRRHRDEIAGSIGSVNFGVIRKRGVLGDAAHASPLT